MVTSGQDPGINPSVKGLGWTSADTAYIFNCHVCARRDVELIHVHHHKSEMVQHECPCCGSKIGPAGPIAQCKICCGEFGLAKA